MRTPPHNIDAEEGLLAACVLDGGRDTMTLCLESRLPREAFFKETHQVIFYALQELYREATAVDEVILADFLQARLIKSVPGWQRHPKSHDTLLDFIGGSANLDYLTGRIETVMHAPHWLRIVRDQWRLRALLNFCQQSSEEVFLAPNVDALFAQAEARIFALSQDTAPGENNDIAALVDRTAESIQRMLLGESPRGLESGFLDLDKLTFGLQPAEMIVLAARPSMGKTSLGLNIAENVALPAQGEPAATLVFSLEMSADALVFRLLCGRARVNGKRIRDRLVNRQEQQALHTAANEIRSAPLLLDASSGLNILELRAKARRYHARQPLSLIVVDYLQLIRGTDPRIPREQQIAEISNGLKGMAKELGVPVLVLSQLNRESEKEKRAPRLSDLRESGSIEQDADVVMLLAKSREGEDEDGEIPQAQPVRDLIIAKNRNGPVGTLKLTFLPELTRFENYSAHQKEA